jgi:hypothetical protein
MSVRQIPDIFPRFIFANAAARTSATLGPSDIGSLAFQEDDGSIWSLKDDIGPIWVSTGAGGVTVTTLVHLNPSIDSPYSISSGSDAQKVFLINSVNGAMTMNLPNPVAHANFLFTIKDSGGTCSINNITLVRFAGEKIEGLAANYVIDADFNQLTFGTDGTDWFIITG